MSGGLRTVPVTFAQAKAFITDWHRRLRPPAGHKYSIGVADDRHVLVGVAVVGRPVARLLDDGLTLPATPDITTCGIAVRCQEPVGNAEISGWTDTSLGVDCRHLPCLPPAGEPTLTEWPVRVPLALAEEPTDMTDQEVLRGRRSTDPPEIPRLRCVAPPPHTSDGRRRAAGVTRGCQSSVSDLGDSGAHLGIDRRGCVGRLVWCTPGSFEGQLMEAVRCIENSEC